MPTKQVKMTFQVKADNGTAADVVISQNNQVKFSGSLPHTSPVSILGPDGVGYSTQSVTFDVSVPLYQLGASTELTTPVETTILCANGTLVLDDTSANFSQVVTTDESNNIQILPGSEDTFVICDIPTDPLFNGEPDHSLYNAAENYTITGPGQILINKSVELTVTHNVPLHL